MKTKSVLSTFPFILTLIVWCSFSSCLKESCEKTSYYKLFTPVYMSYEGLRASIKSMPPVPLKETGKIYFKYPYLYVNEIDLGIHVIDNSNPLSPQNIAFINIPGNVDIAIKGNILYADSYIDLVAIDISNVSNITEVKRFTEVFPNRNYGSGFNYDPAKGVIVNWVERDTVVKGDCDNNSTLFIGNESIGVQFDGSTFGSSVNSPGNGIAGSTAKFALVESYLYCLTNNDMQLFNVSSPESPVQGNAIQMSGSIETIFPYENYLFIGSKDGVYIYDNSNPTAPTYLTQFVHSYVCDPVVVSNDIAYSTLRSGNACLGFTNQLDIIDVSDMALPKLIISYDMTNPFGLGIDGDLLFVCDGPDGLEMYDVSDSQNIILLQTVALQNPIDVIPLNGLLIVVTDKEFFQFDYSSGTLVQLSSMSRNQL